MDLKIEKVANNRQALAYNCASTILSKCFLWIFCPTVLHKLEPNSPKLNAGTEKTLKAKLKRLFHMIPKVQEVWKNEAIFIKMKKYLF